MPGTQANKFHLYWQNMESQTNRVLIKSPPVFEALPCRNAAEMSLSSRDCPYIVVIWLHSLPPVF
jgi:hypothetical protein